MKNHRKRHSRTSSLELSRLTTSRAKRLTQLSAQLQASFTPEQRMMMIQLTRAHQTDVDKILTRLVALVTTEVLTALER
jgi:hypothetical protein